MQVAEAVPIKDYEAAVKSVSKKLDVHYKFSKKIVDDFLLKTYVKGMDNAERIINQNLSFTERDRDIVKLLQDSGGQLIKSVSDRIKKDVSFQVQQSILNNEGIEPLVKRLREIQEISDHNLERIARTETIRTLAVSTINGYEQSGIVEKVSFLTAEDERVCNICMGLDGQVFELSESITKIPAHVQCRCSWAPIVDFSKIE